MGTLGLSGKGGVAREEAVRSGQQVICEDRDSCPETGEANSKIRDRNVS